MSSVLVIGGARSLAGNHGRAERRPRRAFLAESRTIPRALQSSQNEPANARGRFAGHDVGNIEKPFGIVIAKLVSNAIAGFRYHADPAPIAVDHLEHFGEYGSGVRIAVAPSG